MGRGFDDEFSDKDLLSLLGVRGGVTGPGAEAAGHPMLWRPPIDVLDEGDAYQLSIELPGVEEESIELSVEGTSLTLKGERIPNTTEKVLCYHRMERPEGPFSRTLELPEPVDPAGMERFLVHGVLRLVLPKLSEPDAGQG